MNLTKSLACIDFESTSADPLTAKIVEIGCSILHPSGEIKPNGWSQRLNPGCPIPPEASAIHGITDEDVKDCPPFLSIAPTLLARLAGKDLCGFNLRQYDLILLDSEFRRCGLKLNMDGVHVVDAFNLFRKKKPRDLAAYVREYCGRELEGAHGAGVDAAATLEGLVSSLMVHEDLHAMSLPELAAYSVMGDKVPADIAGKLYRDAAGVLRFNFGKNQGGAVLDYGDYCRWMGQNGFPGSTMDVIDEEFAK